MNEAMQKLVDAVQKASPVVWQAAYRQVWIDGAENVLLAILFGIGAAILWKWRAQILKNDDDSTEPGPVLLAVGTIALTVVTIPFIICAMDCFLNPTFAAIKQLKGLL